MSIQPPALGSRTSQQGTPGVRVGDLPTKARAVAIIDVLLGGIMVITAFFPPGQRNPYALVFGVLVLLGCGVLMRSNVARIAARIAHLLFAAGVLAILAVMANSALRGGQGSPASGGSMVALLTFVGFWTLGVAAYFVWGFFVLGRSDAVDACRRSMG